MSGTVRTARVSAGLDTSPGWARVSFLDMRPDWEAGLLIIRPIVFHAPLGLDSCHHGKFGSEHSRAFLPRRCHWQRPAYHGWYVVKP